MEYTAEQLTKFWSLVDKSAGPDGCWIWTGGKFVRGYGGIKLNGKTVKAHRVAYSNANGAIPAGLFCCHRCDNPPCVNPEHLFLGTPADNTRDMIGKGRSNTPAGELHWSKTKPHLLANLPRGSSHVMVRLKESQVKEIRRIHAASEQSTYSLGRQYGVSQSQVWKIIQRKRWAHVA